MLFRVHMSVSVVVHMVVLRASYLVLVLVLVLVVVFVFDVRCSMPALHCANPFGFAYSRPRQT